MSATGAPTLEQLAAQLAALEEPLGRMAARLAALEGRPVGGDAIALPAPVAGAGSGVTAWVSPGGGTNANIESGNIEERTEGYATMARMRGQFTVKAAAEIKAGEKVILSKFKPVVETFMTTSTTTGTVVTLKILANAEIILVTPTMAAGVVFIMDGLEWPLI